MGGTVRVVLLLAALTTVAMLSLQLVTLQWAVGKYATEPAKFDVRLRGQQEATSKSVPVFHTLAPLPVVLMHGMGDAAQNSGMKHIRDLVAKTLGTYTTNIQIGRNAAEDAKNSFFMNMDDQLRIFAQEVRKDPKLQNGFNAAGFSQGNLLIRGYVERYNDPPVRNFISMHGPLAGVGALPQCSPTQFICKEINEIIGAAVYSDKVQAHLAQANYFRDPIKIPEFLEHAKFLPDLNNEKSAPNATYRTNFVTLESLILVRAKHDTQVFPKESEWFGAYQDGAHYNQVLGFNETRWYKEDLFGLQTLDRQNKVHFLETEGNHLQFTTEFFLDTISKYFAPALTQINDAAP